MREGWWHRFAACPVSGHTWTLAWAATAVLGSQQGEERAGTRHLWCLPSEQLTVPWAGLPVHRENCFSRLSY